jgi:hypothetical protein
MKLTRSKFGTTEAVPTEIKFSSDLCDVIGELLVIAYPDMDF